MATVRYRRRWWVATKSGVDHRLGGRWGGWSLVGPFVLAGGIQFVGAGDSTVTTASIGYAIGAGLIGVSLWAVVVVVWSALMAPAELAAQDESQLALTKSELETMRTERDLLRQPGNMIRTFLALYEEGEKVNHGFDLDLPWADGAMDSAIKTYEGWWERVRTYAREYRPKYDLDLTAAQRVAPLPTPRFVAIGDKAFDLELPLAFKTRTSHVQTILRKIIDAG